MRLLKQISDLTTVAGGLFSHTEFVTEDSIFYQSVLTGVMTALAGGVFGYVGGRSLGQLHSVAAGHILGGAFSVLSAEGLGYFGYTHCDYRNIPPNSAVTWDYSLMVLPV